MDVYMTLNNGIGIIFINSYKDNIPIDIYVKMGCKPSVANERRRAFMEEKKLYADDPAMQKLLFSYILDPSSAPSGERREHYRKCQERLDKLIEMVTDRTYDSVTDAKIQSFEDFCEIASEWNRPDAFVLHRDHHCLKHLGSPSQRVQIRGLCYIHAPDMMQHYLVCINTKTNAGMIDMCRFIHECFSVHDIQKHIFDEEGGGSLDILQRILVPNSKITPASLDTPEIVADHLKRDGPGLVSMFKVYADFTDDTRHSHDVGLNSPCKIIGIENDGMLGYHAMVLIGCRQDAAGSWWFLLQNWWKAKQFVEVSISYLQMCGAMVYFAKTPQPCIPSVFPQSSARVCEGSDIDKRETFLNKEYL